ncbi:DUF7507 domain-containing protein, partial [Mobilicoccus pelagius]
MIVDRRPARRSVARPGGSGILRLLAAGTATVLAAAGLAAPLTGEAARAATPATAPASPTTSAPSRTTASPGLTRTGRSADGRLTLTVTPSVDTRAVPISGTAVEVTYRVTNTTANPAYYRGLSDTGCSTPGIDPDDPNHGGLASDGVRWWVPARGTATFSCDVLVTEAGTAVATATFDTSLEDTAAPTASVATVRTPISMATHPCDTMWYSSTPTPLGAPVPTSPGTIGRIDTRKGKRTFTPVFRLGALAGGRAGTGSPAFAVDASRPHSAYFVGDSAGVSRGLFRLDLRTGATMQVTGVSPATSTLRLAADKVGRVWSWAVDGHLYTLEPGSSTWTERRLASITDVDGRQLDVSSFQAGDIAVGGNGGLWMIAGDQISRRTYVLTLPSDVSSTAALEATVVGRVASPPNGGYDNGLDFGADGHLYSTTGPNAAGDGATAGTNQLFRIDPATGSRTVVGTAPTAGVGSVADVGSCALPRSDLSVTTTTSAETSSVTTGDRITYTVRVASIGRVASVRSRLLDTIPAHTRYVPRSTTLNGIAVADVDGAMPYTARDAEGHGRTEIHSPGARRGVVAAGKSAVVRFTVQVGDVKGVDEITHRPVVVDKSRTFVSDDPTRPGREDATATLVARPRIQVTQSVDSSSVTGTGAATYVAVVRNVGTEPLAGVSLDGTTTAKRGDATGPVDDDTCAHPMLRRSSDAAGDGLLDVGEVWVYTCTQPIRWGPGDPDSWTVGRTASTTAAGGVSSDVVDANADPVETVVRVAPAALDASTERATVVGPDSATGRLEATYTVRVRNSGQKGTTYAAPTFRPQFARGLRVVGARYMTPDAPDRPLQALLAADGSFTLGEGERPIGAERTHDYKVAVALMWTSTTPAAPCSGRAGGGLYASVDLADGVEKGTRRNNATCLTPPAPPAPRVALTQTSGGVVDADGDGRIGVGDTVSHAFVVTNHSRTLTLSDIRVDAPLAGTVTCAADRLAVGARTMCRSEPHRLTVADLARGSITSTARVSATPPGLPARTARASTTTRIPTTTGVRPGLGSATGTPRVRVTRTVALADTDRDGSAGAGDLATHTFTVQNTGTATVRALSVDAPGLGLTGFSCTNADLRPAARTTCRVVVPLGQRAVDAGVLRGTATITARHAGRPVTTRTGVRFDLLRSKPAVRNALSLTSLPGGIIDANASGTVDPGDLIRYAFDIRNTGTQTLDLLQVRDAGLPNALNRAEGTCTQGTLAPGESTTCLSKLGHAITAADLRAGAFTNAAVATARDPRGKVVASATARSRKTIPNAPRVVLEVVPGSVVDAHGTRPGDSAGDTLGYHYLVRNVGGTPVTDIRLTDPALGLDATPCATGIAGPAAPLRPGATRRCGVATAYVLTRRDVDARRIVRTSTVTVAGPDGKDRTTRSKPVTTTLTPRPGVALTLTHDGGSRARRVGDRIRYRYTVTNTGAGTLSSVRIVDPRLGIDAPCTTAQATVPSTGPGRRLVCTLTGGHTVTREDVAGGRVQNDAEVVAAAGLGIVRASATDVVPTAAPSVSARLVPSGASITDVDGDGRTGAGDLLEHRFTVTNTGDLPVVATSLTDRAFRSTGRPCPSDAIEPGESVECRLTRTLSAADVRAGRLTTASVVGVRAGRRTAAARSGHTVLLSARSPLAVRQRTTLVDSNGNGFLDAGERATFTVSVTNVSHRTGEPATYTRIVVDDPMFTGIDPACVLPEGGLRPGATVTCRPVTWRATPQDTVAVRCATRSPPGRSPPPASRRRRPHRRARWCVRRPPRPASVYA